MNTEHGRKTPVAPTFASELLRLRKVAGLSLRDLAAIEGVHISASHLWKLERGKRSPTILAGEELDCVFRVRLDQRQYRPGRLIDLAERHDPARDRLITRPAQLPAANAVFVGRATEIGQLNAAVSEVEQPGTPRIAVVAGTPGIGKTELVVQWAHRVMPRFRDGQLYIDLGGWPREQRRAPCDVLGELLRALGVLEADIPTSGDERATRWRSAAHGRTMLIVLDNAATADQVLPLLPGTTDCMVVVTTRADLPGLPAATWLRLPPLPREESHALLRGVLGPDRAEAEPRAIEDLARRCDGLPLALRTTASRIMHRPHGLTDSSDDLLGPAAAASMLDSATDTRSVRERLSWSYQQLQRHPALARLFRILGAHHEREITVPEAANLAGCSQRSARHRLEELGSLCLLEPVGSQRYRKQGLVHAYAAERADEEEPPHELQQATRRWLKWLVQSALAAHRMLDPWRMAPTFGGPVEEIEPEVFADHLAARAWYARHLDRLEAAIQRAIDCGTPRSAWKLPVAFAPYLRLRQPWETWITAHKRGLQAARAAEDPHGQAWCLHELGVALARLGHNYSQAQQCFDEAIGLRGALEDSAELGWSLCHRGTVFLDTARIAQARADFEHAHAWFAERGDDYGQASALAWRGETDRLLGHSNDAVAVISEALGLFDRLGQARDGVAFALARLADVHADAYRWQHARDYAQRARTIRRELHDAAGEGDVLLAHGFHLRAAGHWDQAKDAWRQAAVRFNEADDPRAKQAERHLVTLAGHIAAADDESER